MKYLIERIAEYLVKHGPTSARTLGIVLGEPTARISSALKQPAQRGRWGISRTGYDEEAPRQGHPPSIWAIDRTKYKAHLANRRDMPWIAKRVLKKKIKPGPAKGTKSKAPCVKEPKVDYRRKPPVYSGPHRTVWQPSSPYWRET